MYPHNAQNYYSYLERSPEIIFEFSASDMRNIKANSLRFGVRQRIMRKDTKQTPANRFDVPSINNTDSFGKSEEVVYINERIGVNSVINTLTIGSLDGSTYEQCRQYNRIFSNVVSLLNGYQTMLTLGSHLYTSSTNNDMISRLVSSECESETQLYTGFLKSFDLIDLSKGLRITIQLESDSQVLFGASASNYTYQLYDVYLCGDYVNFSAPVEASNDDYSSYTSFNSVINTSSTHGNLMLNMSQVANLHQSFLPNSWNNNYSFDAFSLCKPMNTDNNGKWDPKNGIQIVTFNKNSVRYPYTYDVNEKLIYDNFQTVRSKHYISSIVSYFDNAPLLSPFTEQVKYMVTERSDALETPNQADGGMLYKWKKEVDNTTNLALFKKSDVPEGSRYIYGYGVNYDSTNSGITSNFQNSTFNFNYTTDLNNTSTQIYTTVTSKTMLMNQNGRVMAVN